MHGELDDRYEPLPGLLELPRFVWQRLPRAAKFAAMGAALAAVVAAIVLAPVIQRSKQERAREEAAQSARIQRQELEQTRREQRPRFARAAPAGMELAARGRLLASAAASIRSDAGARAAAGEFNGPIMRVECEGYPPTAEATPPDADPTKRTGRYACIAVTSEISATPGSRSGLLGHPYRLRIDFRSGRYAFCKIRGRPGELAVRLRSPVPVPRACGG